MKTAAYQQFRDESSSWLKEGRSTLIESLLHRHLDGRHSYSILDLGAGMGQNIAPLSKFGTVDALEHNPVGLEALRKNPRVHRIFSTSIPEPLESSFDLIGAFDVIEHVEHEDVAVDWIADHLTPGGTLIATVPAYNWMFSGHDVAVEHFRRYSKQAFREVLERRNFKVLQTGYFVSTLFPLAVLSRIPSIFRYRRGLAEGTTTKQGDRMPGLINALFERVLAAEAWTIGKGIDLPFGLSVYALAQKV